MALQDTHEVKMLPMSPAAMSVAQAKANLLMLGEEAQAERRERLGIAGIVRKAAVWGPIVGALLGLAAGRVGGGTQRREVHRGGRAAGVGISLGLMIRILKPLVPIVIKYFSLKRRAKQVAREQQRQRAAYAR